MTHNEEKKQQEQIKNYTEYIIVDKNIKTVAITVFHMFKKLQERLKMLSRDREDI